jgi:predicted nucleotidyltransferase
MSDGFLHPSKQKIAAFCEHHNIRKLALFGSVLREDFRLDSHVDVLVEFEPGHIPGFFHPFDLQEELSAIFGRKVDLRTPEDLSRYFRAEVVAGAQVQLCPRVMPSESGIYSMPPGKRQLSFSGGRAATGADLRFQIQESLENVLKRVTTELDGGPPRPKETTNDAIRT